MLDEQTLLDISQNAKPPSITPWGVPMHIAQLAPGMWCIDTPRHGGIALVPERYQVMPEALRANPYGGQELGLHFFEEDLEALFPLVFFRDELDTPERKNMVQRAFDALARLAGQQEHRADPTYGRAYSWVHENLLDEASVQGEGHD